MNLVVWIETRIGKIDYSTILIDERTFIKFLTTYINDKKWLEKEDVWDTMGKMRSVDNIEKAFEKKFGWSLEHCVFCRQRMYLNDIKHDHDCPIPKLESVVSYIRKIFGNRRIQRKFYLKRRSHLWPRLMILENVQINS